MTSVRSTAIHAAVAALICGFVAFTVCVSVGPLNRWTQETAACPGADRVQRDVRRGNDVQSGTRAGDVHTSSTTVVELVCTYGDERREVGNDEAALKGFLWSFALGAVPGGALVVIRRGLRR